jgi:hypothetical protein
MFLCRLASSMVQSVEALSAEELKKERDGRKVWLAAVATCSQEPVAMRLF